MQIQDTRSALSDKANRRLKAVLALFRGEKAATVSQQFNINCSDLYKFRQRALIAMRQALEDQPRGPKRPANKINSAQEHDIVALCERFPTQSSYQLYRRLHQNRPSPRTIQRIRLRNGLPRVTKRAPPVTPARRLSKRVIDRALQLIKQKPHLGPERISWDLKNADNITISPSTIKRLKYITVLKPKPVWQFYERQHPHSLWHGDFMEKIKLTNTHPAEYALHFALMDDHSRGYVFCDLFVSPDQREVIRGIIAAIRQWLFIPEAIIFDNGSAFSGVLLSSFCERIGIRLTHTSVCHPQTNGKLERGFRDDMRDFYQQFDKWFLDDLRRDLPEYVHYRNFIRGHQALDGKPSITRLQKQPRVAKPTHSILNHLEDFVYHEIRKTVVPYHGSLHMFGRNAYLGTQYAGAEVTLVETLDGLEAKIDGACIGMLKNYRDMKKMVGSYTWDKFLPHCLYFESASIQKNCPRIAVA